MGTHCIIHLYKVQEQAKLIYDVRSQDSWKGSNQKGHEGLLEAGEIRDLGMFRFFL